MRRAGLRIRRLKILASFAAASALALLTALLPISARAEDCAFPSAPHVIRAEDDLLLQYWLIEDHPNLYETILPATPSLREFRERITQSFDTAPRGLLERQLPHTSGADTEDIRLVLTGEAGSIRPMSCLEALLLATQTERSVGEGRSMYSYPTEFTSYVLKRNDTLKIWFFTVDQPGIRGLAILHEPLMADLEAGWTVITNIHNHNFFPEAEAVQGGTVPSATDIQYLRNMHGSLGLTQASITNGFDSVDLSLTDFERLKAP